MTKKRSRHTCDNMEELVYLHEVWRGAGLGGGHEDALGVIFFFNSMKHITFNTFSCLLFVDLRLHLNDCDFDSCPLFLVSLFVSLHIHIHFTDTGARTGFITRRGVDGKHHIT